MRLLILGIVLLVVSPVRAQNVVIPDSAANAATNNWLALVDSAQYAQSWATAAPVFQANVSEAQWKQAAAQARGPLGAMLDRVLVSVRTVDQIPNMPPGRYMVLEYASRFAQVTRAVETHVLEQQADDLWQTVGYFVRPAQ